MNENGKISRRELIAKCGRSAAAVGIGGSLAYMLVGRGVQAQASAKMVWQTDPSKCIQCGNCATKCVLQPSAVKCVHAFDVCGYCDLCTGFLRLKHLKRDTAAENGQCPTNAITRAFIEDPYYEFTIDESRCTGCGKCVAGCAAYGNGSLFLQVRHDRCLNCNQCSIARQCPAQAYTRVPASSPYILKHRGDQR